MSDSCSNSPWVNWWTCPRCYTDHSEDVEKCKSCGVPLKCEVDFPPVYVCSVREPEDDE